MRLQAAVLDEYDLVLFRLEFGLPMGFQHAVPAKILLVSINEPVAMRNLILQELLLN